MGADDSIVAELTSWRSRRAVGLSRCRLEYEIDRRYERRLHVVVKVKPEDEHVIAVGESVARLCDQAVGSAYARFRDRIGFKACHVRELAVYAQRDPRFRRHAPRCWRRGATMRGGTGCSSSSTSPTLRS